MTHPPTRLFRSVPHVLADATPTGTGAAPTMDATPTGTGAAWTIDAALSSPGGTQVRGEAP